MVGFPLLLIPLAIYNIIVFLMPGVSLSAPLVSVTLMSGVSWSVSLSDVLLSFGILMLLLEVIKGARPGAKYFTDHLLSLIVFGGAAAEFVMLPQFGTSTYFLLALLALVDFLGGVSLRARRSARAMAAAPAPVSQNNLSRDEAVSEPRFEPVPAPEPVIHSVEPIVEPVPIRTEPTVVHSAAAATAASPEVPSPGLQPGSGSHPSPESPTR